MYILKLAEKDTVYFGFYVRTGFFYGVDTKADQPIVASRVFEQHGFLCLWILNGNQWASKWIKESEDCSEFMISGLPEIIDPREKVPFFEWLKNKKGISQIEWEKYFEKYDSGLQLAEEYEQYFFNGLPQFARKQYTKNK